ncbi:MAG TPA: molybdenum cofactor guanylyltransferase [Bacteroidales bacterium]|nr:molybdenum cofactor guanylyltransferase [Bacteroidales bacterium]
MTHNKEQTRNISAAILAGGTAKRLGGISKSNVVIGGKTVISRIMEALSGLFNEIIVVSNTPGAFSDLEGIRIVRDVYPGIGPLAGIHAALKSAHSEAVFIVAGDMPLLSVSLIKFELEEYFRRKPDVLIPKTGDLIEPLHSVFSTQIENNLEEFITGRKTFAVREYLKIVRTEYFEPPDLKEAMRSFININSPEDIERIEKLYTKSF